MQAPLIERKQIVKRLILFGLLGGLLATNTGCGLFQAIFCYRPCSLRNGCGPAYACDDCDDGCGPTCGPVVRRPVRAMRNSCGCATCGRAYRTAACSSCGSCDSCDSCGDPCGDPCGDACYGRPWHRGPLSCAFAWLFSGFGCCSGCGERYWGDFYSDGPDCWDPCDCYGNYAGGGCKSCGGGGSGYSEDYGTYPTVHGGGHSGGCKNCNRGHANANVFDDGDADGGQYEGGEVIQRGNVVTKSDRAAGANGQSSQKPHKATRP